MADPLSANPRRRATVRELVLVYLMAVVAFGYFAGTWGDGNTNSRLRFTPRPDDEFDVSSWMNRWAAHAPTHHVALGVGHLAATIEKAASLIGIECVRA